MCPNASNRFPAKLVRQTPQGFKIQNKINQLFVFLYQNYQLRSQRQWDSTGCHICPIHLLLVARPSTRLAAPKPTPYARAVTMRARQTVHLPSEWGRTAATPRPLDGQWPTCRSHRKYLLGGWAKGGVSCPLADRRRRGTSVAKWERLIVS